MRAKPTIVLALALGLGAGVVGCKDVAQEVAKKTVKAGKDTAKGLKEGVEEGRKEGASGDGAVVVTSLDELNKQGSVKVAAKRPSKKHEGKTEIELVFENTGDKPLRISGLTAIVLDTESFAKKPLSKPGELTVEPRAKDKMLIAFDVAPDKVKTVRIWGTDLEVGGS